MEVKDHLRQTNFELMLKLVIMSPICKNKISKQRNFKKYSQDFFRKKLAYLNLAYNFVNVTNVWSKNKSFSRLPKFILKR